MAVITITSDLGTRDFYVAALKGTILTYCGNVSITDISHSVKSFDIKEAAFIIKSAYKYFPKGSIHIVHVNSNDSNEKLLVAVADGHYFITFDSGLLSLTFDSVSHQVFRVNDEMLGKNSLIYEDAIARVIELLLKEYVPSDFGYLVSDNLSLRLLQPITSQGSIRGAVIYIDHFGNAVINITRKIFDEFIGNRNFTVFANVAHTNAINKSHTEAEEGEMVCVFNSEGYLEVTVNRGKAESLMGLKVGSSVLISAD